MGKVLVLYLLVYEVCPDWIISGVVPGSEDLFTKEEPPWSVSFLGPHFFGILFTLRYGIHHVVISTP